MSPDKNPSVSLVGPKNVAGKVLEDNMAISLEGEMYFEVSKAFMFYSFSPQML